MTDPDLDTALLCNKLLDTLDRMTDVAREVAQGAYTGDMLRLTSALLVWCDDARENVMEIKSLL